jgi:transcriptional regulator with XRE-family HTH domain
MVSETDFCDILPPLSSAEFEALKEDIKANGVLVPIVVDENDVILDGHHRYKIDNNAPRRVIKGLSDEEKQAYTIRANMARRNLSPSQKQDLLKKQKQIAKQLREQDAKRWTQKAVAGVLGVAHNTVSTWFTDQAIKSNATNFTNEVSCVQASEQPKVKIKPDARVKVNTEAKKEIATRVKSGEKQEQVAADYGITRQAVSKIASKAEEIHSRDEDKARKTAHLKNTLYDVRRGDFREVLSDVSSVSLILTDPPYPKESLPLWSHLGEWAANALADDGILVAYSGQMFLPDVLNRLSEHLDFWWCGAVVHKGSGNLTPLGCPVRKVINRWKPLVMFIKKTGCGFMRPFADLIDGDGPQKTDHNWQQPVAEAAMIIEAFTREGELVVDPFAGSGGFCKAASDLKRIAIGAEILNG